MTDHLLLTLPVLIPMASAIAALCARKKTVLCRGLLLLGSGASLLCGILLLLQVMEAGNPLSTNIGNWQKPIGISFRADLFSVLMIVVSGIVGFCGAMYACGEIGKSTWRHGYGTFYCLLFTGINGAFLTNDLFNLFVWFEVMLMSSFAMLVLGRRKYVYEGATKYVVINMVSSFFFLSGLGVLYGKTGHLNLDEIASQLATSGTDPIILSSSALLLMAFGIKAGVFPLYFWLPPAYPNTGFTTAAVFGGLLTKVGIYALFRLFGGSLSFLAPIITPLFLGVALVTMITGVLGAASQFNTRRILSFHIISQIGYILLGLGLYSFGAMAAAIFYILHHILVKTNLFLAAGLIAATGRSDKLDRLGGLLKAQPILAVLFLIPALSLGGIPPLSGFFAKFLILREAFRMDAYLTAGIALAVGIFTLFSMIKIWGEVFWKDTPRSTGTQAIRNIQLLPVVILAACTLATGVFVGPLYSITQEASTQLLESNPLYTQSEVTP